MKDIYTITPEIEAQLSHALTILTEYLEDCYLEGKDADGRVEEATEILTKLPFFAKNY